jgi:hypothetical protein
MKARTSIENPAQIEVTMTISMKFEEWERLSSQLAVQWPSSDLARLIGASIQQVKGTTLADSERIQ